MCGFLGEFSFVNKNVTDRDTFDTLLELSKHRGPDSTEIIKDKNYQLGFNRLAILDLSSNNLLRFLDNLLILYDLLATKWRNSLQT